MGSSEFIEKRLPPPPGVTLLQVSTEVIQYVRPSASQGNRCPLAKVRRYGQHSDKYMFYFKTCQYPLRNLSKGCPYPLTPDNDFALGLPIPSDSLVARRLSITYDIFARLPPITCNFLQYH
jgi:hypothetical protein